MTKSGSLRHGCNQTADRAAAAFSVERIRRLIGTLSHGFKKPRPQDNPNPPRLPRGRFDPTLAVALPLAAWRSRVSQNHAELHRRARGRVAITRKHYAVHTVRDEPVRLRDQLDHIAADGGRVVSVIWQPARQVTLEPGLPPYEVASGYVVVSEHELPEAGGH